MRIDKVSKQKQYSEQPDNPRILSSNQETHPNPKARTGTLKINL